MWSNGGTSRLVLFFFLVLFSLQVFGQENETESKAQGQNWNELELLLTELEREAITLSDDSEKLRTLLLQAQIGLTELSSKLESSRIQASELSSSLALSATSFESFAQSELKERKSLKIELWVWRVTTVLGLVGIIAVLVK
jgi:hypothetical protein